MENTAPLIAGAATAGRYRIFVGFSPEEMRACVVAERSLQFHCRQPLDIRRISRLSLWHAYQRPMTYLPTGQRYDVISQAPMSTDHAIARFFVPWLCDYRGWALFVDGDILCRRSITELFAHADERYAVLCVQHPPLDAGDGAKKDGEIQTAYPYKNWSSVLLFNCGHPANRELTLDRLNTVPGRDLHAFDWLTPAEIGALPAEWNYLVGVTPQQADPAIVHYTLGLPTLPGHEHDPFAAEWFALARSAGYRLLQPTALAVDMTF
jgi:lipopolysaccharide biosynthesis glycosyltransferase